LASADAPLIYCVGSACGGHGPTAFAYEVDSASFPMMEFQAGTNDLDPENYTNVLTPEGWNFAVEREGMSHAHGLHTPHGEVSPGPCYCLTAGRVRWWTDDPAYAVEFFTFGYDHRWSSEDTGWDLLTRREGDPPQYYDFHGDWDSPVGVGMGPVHGASGPYGDLNYDGCVDQADLGLFLADWDCEGDSCIGDIDHDGDTDQADLGLLLAYWGEGCP
jgi:hypothetical protein